MHLGTEAVTNAGPYGLVILTGRGHTSEAEVAEDKARWATVEASVSQISPARWEALETKRGEIQATVEGGAGAGRSSSSSSSNGSGALLDNVVGGAGYGQTEDDVWMMAPADHAALLIHNGGDVGEALAEAKKPYVQMRSVLKDMWNTPGVLKGSTGMPYVTSHYGYHMTLWHLPLALSGQDADLPSGRLSFAPKIPAPFELPLLLPGTWGLVSATVSAGGGHGVQRGSDHGGDAGAVDA